MGFTNPFAKKKFKKNSKGFENLDKPAAKKVEPRIQADSNTNAGGSDPKDPPEPQSRTDEEIGTGEAKKKNKEGEIIDANSNPRRPKNVPVDQLDDLKDGLDPKVTKKSFAKSARETVGKAVKLTAGALILHQMGIIDITDPLGQVEEEEQCKLNCEDKHMGDGQKTGECIEQNCKDAAGGIIGTVVNLIVMIIVGVILYNVGKKILKKKGKVGESSGDSGYDDSGYDDGYNDGYDDYRF